MDLNKLKKFSRNMRVKLIEQIEQPLNYVLGVEDEYTQVHSDASMAFVGNTSKSVSYMLKHSNLFNDLPGGYQDSASSSIIWRRC